MMVYNVDDPDCEMINGLVANLALHKRLIYCFSLFNYKYFFFILTEWLTGGSNLDIYIYIYIYIYIQKYIKYVK